jgi:nucleoside-diphosphate-sugar epimerase
LNDRLRVLVTGATGFVGSRLVDALGGKQGTASAAWCEIRRERTSSGKGGHEVRHGDLLEQETLAGAREGPPLTYFRAAMVVGSRSESFRTLRYLVAGLFRETLRRALAEEEANK